MKCLLPARGLTSLRIWVTRTQPGANATAARLTAMGHMPIVQPVLKAQPIPNAALDLAGVDALAFTSGHAITAFAALSPERDLPVFTVGEASALLARLAREEATVMELAQPFSMSQPAISRHLKVLEEAGLILRRVDGTRRPCRLAPEGVAAVDQWLDMLRQALARNYDRLDQVLAEMNSLSKQKRKSP